MHNGPIRGAVLRPLRNTRMLNHRSEARICGVFRRKRILRGMERLESRCVLSAGAMLPTAAGLLPRIVEVASKQDSSAVLVDNTLPSRDPYIAALASAPSQSWSPATTEQGRLPAFSSVADLAYRPATSAENWTSTPSSTLAFNTGSPRFFDLAPVDVQVYVIQFVVLGGAAVHH